MKRYEEYKDSGIDWLGEIPAHWEARRLKFCVSLSMQKLLTKPEQLPYIGLENIESQTGRLLMDVQPEIVESTVSTFNAGDVLFNKLRPYLAKVVLVDFDGVCTTELLVFHPRGNLIEARYLFYRLLSDDFIQLVNSFTYGTKMPRANKEQITNISIQIPPLAEQDAIVAFLDRKLAEIDHFIANKQRAIELLKEQKAAIINHAVTRGIEPGVEMKSSGIEWLGEIPAHWETKKARYIFREINERSKTGLETHLSMSQKFGLIEADRIEEKTLQSETQEGFKLCTVNDLVLNKLKAHLGVFARATRPGLVSPDYAVFRLSVPANVQYFELLYKHPAYIGAFNKAARGIVIGFLRLYTPEFYNIRMLFPPKEEQDRIIRFIQGEVAKVDLVINRAEREIELIKEYRTTLIADAVTGKLDVRVASRVEAEARLPV